MRVPRILAAIVLAFALIASSASAVTMAWMPIGSPGNDCYRDPQQGGCVGAVGYAYNIGTYDVTNAQYAEFLNAKARTDPLALYDTNMANPLPDLCCVSGYGGITRSGSAGSYSYSALAGRENMPVNWVSWYDAARFANWMNNGQGGGDTETGAYTLLGGTATPSNGTLVTRNAGATIFLPSEDEWYKAAYYDAASTSYNAYPFADGFNGVTCESPAGTTGHSANCDGVVGDLTPVGSYAGSPSPYGTFDQGGNVEQWNETRAIINRGLRGGAFNTYPFALAGSTSAGWAAANASVVFGFRLAMIPEPGTGLLVIAGLVGLAVRRRARA